LNHRQGGKSPEVVILVSAFIYIYIYINVWCTQKTDLLRGYEPGHTGVLKSRRSSHGVLGALCEKMGCDLKASIYSQIRQVMKLSIAKSKKGLKIRFCC